MEVTGHVKTALQVLVLALVQLLLLRHGDPAALALARLARIVVADALEGALLGRGGVAGHAADEVEGPRQILEEAVHPVDEPVHRPLRPVDDQGVQLPNDQLEGVPVVA